jgi:phage/plasmid-associated DNA primase
MMNHHELSYEFFLDWLANLFQFPSSTSIFISLSSKEGAGKSGLVDLLTAMVGGDKSKEITDMKNDLFGSFNEDLRDCVLMNINEVERCDAGACYEKLKSQITSPLIRVHPKGQKPYHINNLRKYISTNNNPHAIVIKKGNRRYFATESSDELIGNTEYFTWFYSNIKKSSVQYSFYKFLMARDVKQQLTAVDIPETDLMREAYELNSDPLEDFIRDLPSGEKLYMEDLYTDYKTYMNKIGMEYKMNGKQFSMRFGRLVTAREHEKGKMNKVTDGVRDQRVYYILANTESLTISGLE